MSLDGKPPVGSHKCRYAARPNYSKNFGTRSPFIRDVLDYLIHKDAIKTTVIEWKCAAVKTRVVYVWKMPTLCIGDARLFNVNAGDRIQSARKQFFVVTAFSAAKVKPVARQIFRDAVYAVFDVERLRRVMTPLRLASYHHPPFVASHLGCRAIRRAGQARIARTTACIASGVPTTVRPT